MDGSTEEESRAGDSHSMSSRDQDGWRRRSRSPVRRRSKERSRHSHKSKRDRAVSELSRHRSNQRDFPTVDDRQSSELSWHRSNKRDLPTMDDRQSSELSRHRSNQWDLPTVDYRQYYDYGRQVSESMQPPLPAYKPPPRPPLPAYEPPPRPPLPLYPYPSQLPNQGQWGNSESYADSVFTLNKGTPHLQVAESVGGTGRVMGLTVGVDHPSSSVGRGVLSVAPSDQMSSISHASKARTAASLFVTQPVSMGKPSEEKIPAAAGKDKANIYERVSKAASQPSEGDLVESGLFKSFGEVAVVQGVADLSPRFCLNPAQKATLSAALQTTEPWKLKATPGHRLRKYPIHEDSEDFLHVPEIDPLFVKAAACAQAGLSPTDPLVVSRSGENIDRQLKQTQNALQTGLVAACSLQQGLGKLKTK